MLGLCGMVDWWLREPNADFTFARNFPFQQSIFLAVLSRGGPTTTSFPSDPAAPLPTLLSLPPASPRLFLLPPSPQIHPRVPFLLLLPLAPSAAAAAAGSSARDAGARPDE